MITGASAIQSCLISLPLEVINVQISAIFFLVSASFTTMNLQGWAFFPEGAARMAFSIRARTSSGIGVGANLRMLLRV